MMIAALAVASLVSQAHAMGALAPLSCEEQRAEDVAGGSARQAYAAPLVFGGIGTLAYAGVLVHAQQSTVSPRYNLAGEIIGLGALQLVIGAVLQHTGNGIIRTALLDDCGAKARPTARPVALPVIEPTAEPAPEPVVAPPAVDEVPRAPVVPTTR